MRRKLLAIIMIAIMVLAGGCGNKSTATTDTTETTETSQSETDSAENSEAETVESSASIEQEEIVSSSEPIDINSLIVEKTDEELNLKRYSETCEDRTMDNEGEQVFHSDLFTNETEYSGYVTATGNIDIYNVNGIRVGYIVPKTSFDIFGEYEGWYYFYVGENKRFARVEDVDANIKTNKQIAEEREAEEQSRQEQEVASSNPIENVPVEQPVTTPAEPPVEVPVETNSYTAEQAIADYRAIMESNGITWDPSIKEFASWGTGMLPLNKEEVEAAGYSSVQSFSMGDSGGRSYTKYYLEVTGSDENYVYYTKYGCS